MSESNEISGIEELVAAVEHQQRRNDKNERAQALSRAMRAARERSAAIARATLNASRKMYEHVYGKPGERRRSNR